MRRRVPKSSAQYRPRGRSRVLKAVFLLKKRLWKTKIDFYQLIIKIPTNLSHCSILLVKPVHSLGLNEYNILYLRVKCINPLFDTELTTEKAVYHHVILSSELPIHPSPLNIT